MPPRLTKKPSRKDGDKRTPQQRKRDDNQRKMEREGQKHIDRLESRGSVNTGRKAAPKRRKST